MLRIFVAGGTGVIGRRVIPVLVSDGHRVYASSRSDEGRKQIVAQGAEPVAVNLYDSEDVKRGVGHQDVVINLSTHIPSSSTKMLLPWAWRENDRVRREVSANLGDAARIGGADCFIQESFAPIYEDAGDRWIDETWPVRPARYNKSTIEAERAANRFTKHGGRGIILRFAYFYGADSIATRDMIRLVRKGVSPLVGPPDAFISSISHDDAAAAVITAIHLPGGMYNVSDDEPVTRREWAGSLASALGVSPPRAVPGLLAKLGGSTVELLSRSQRLSNRKLREHSDWAPATPSIRDAWPRLVGAEHARSS